MRIFFSLALIGLFTSFYAQEIVYPYNPDANNDQYVAVSDVLSTVSAFGSEFLPTEIQIDGVGLAEVIGQLQASISALEAENAAQAVLITELQNSSGGGIEGLDTYLSVDEATNTVLISGANLQVVSGGGMTDASVNATGNIIIGYDESNGSDKSGSHNLVVGSGHTYSSYGGLVVGSNNGITGAYSSVSGGTNNRATGTESSVSGGVWNEANGDHSSVSGGYQNFADGMRTSILGGQFNTASASAWYGTIVGGKQNDLNGQHTSILGGQGNYAVAQHSSILGGMYNETFWGHSTIVGNAGTSYLDNTYDGNTVVGSNP